jgi:hypothetical protein
MLIPALSLARLASLRLPRLELGQELAAWRSDPSRYRADWLGEVERPELPMPPTLLPHAADGLRGPSASVRHFGPFSLVLTPFQLSLQEQGSPQAWVLDTSWFGGSPLLVVAEVEGGVDIALAEAFFPGTTISAALRASIRCRQGTWTLRLRLKVGGFDATVPLSAWLQRSQVALAPVHLDLACAPLGPASSLTARGPGIAGFTPDWFLAIWSIDGFRFAGLAGEPQADLALVALRPPGGPPLFFPSQLRRTALLFGAAEGFELWPEFTGPGPSFHPGAFRFEALALETALLTDAWALRFLFAQSPAQGSPLGLEPGGGLWGGSGEPFRVPLHQVRYGQLFNQRRERIGAGLHALPDSTPFWLHSAGLSLLLGPAPTRPAIGLLQKDAMPPGVLCRLGLRQSAPRLEGLLVRPEPGPPRAQVWLTWRPLPAPLAPELGHVEIDPLQGTARLRLPADTSLALVRRDDFLHLRVRWTNLRLESEARERRLRSVAPGPAHLAMILPPQSIGEETFPEASGNGGRGPGEGQAQPAGVPAPAWSRWLPARQHQPARLAIAHPLPGPHRAACGPGAGASGTARSDAAGARGQRSAAAAPGPRQPAPERAAHAGPLAGSAAGRSARHRHPDRAAIPAAALPQPPRHLGARPSAGMPQRPQRAVAYPPGGPRRRDAERGTPSAAHGAGDLVARSRHRRGR